MIAKLLNTFGRGKRRLATSTSPIQQRREQTKPPQPAEYRRALKHPSGGGVRGFRPSLDSAFQATAHICLCYLVSFSSSLTSSSLPSCRQLTQHSRARHVRLVCNVSGRWSRAESCLASTSEHHTYIINEKQVSTLLRRESEGTPKEIENKKKAKQKLEVENCSRLHHPLRTDRHVGVKF